MLKGLTRSLMVATMLAGTALAAQAQDFTLRATANSNENDEDYDGLVVFKNYVEQASNGAIAVELFIGTQLCSNGSECLAGVADGNIDVVIQTSGGTANVFPFVQVLDLPYLMADDRVAEHALANGSPFVKQNAGNGGGNVRRRRSSDDHRQYRRLAQLRQHPKAVMQAHGKTSQASRSAPSSPTCRRNWSVKALGASHQPRSRGLNSSPRSRPALSKAPRTASPTSWA